MTYSTLMFASCMFQTELMQTYTAGVVEIAVQNCKRDSTQYLQEDLVSLNCVDCVNLSCLGDTQLALRTDYMASLVVHCYRLPIFLATGPLRSSRWAYKS